MPTIIQYNPPFGSVGVAGEELEPGQCTCPACKGLECLSRPRFYSGQLLSEDELNSEQSYVIAKSRLHNRYLHGRGIACGLTVVCHECKGYVEVRSGYAIDGCGNDIVVCDDTPFDLIGAIQKCKESDRRSQTDCDPLVPVSVECKGVEEE